MSGVLRFRRGARASKQLSATRIQRAFRKSRIRRSRLSQIYPIAMSSFPSLKPITLKYVERIDLTSAVGVVNSNKFRLNSLFDPDFAVGGHQPFLFDQWAQFYGSYNVKRCKVTLTIAAVGAIMRYCLRPTDDTANPTSMNLEIEKPQSKYGVVTGNIPVRVSAVYSPAQILGVNKTKYNAEDNYSAAVGADPVSQALCNLSCQSADGTSTGTIVGTIELIMQGTMFDRQAIGTS